MFGKRLTDSSIRPERIYYRMGPRKCRDCTIVKSKLGDDYVKADIHGHCIKDAGG